MDRFTPQNNRLSQSSNASLNRRRMLKITSRSMAGVLFSGPAAKAFSRWDEGFHPQIDLQGNVRLLPPGSATLEGELGRRFQLNIDYLLWRYRDADRLLFPFEHRDRWHRIHDWDGEYAGKWLDAAVHTLRATTHPELEEATRKFAARLLATQEADGYLGTELPENRLATTWPLWMHWLAMKSLREYGEYSKKEEYLDATVKGADWLLNEFSPIENEKNPYLKESGYLSNIDELSWTYKYTGNRKYYDFAWNALQTYPRLKKMWETGKVDGGHAYSTLTYLGSAVQLAAAGNDQELLSRIKKLWLDIAENHTFSTGSISVNEHFKEQPEIIPDGDLQETCATVEWLLFSHRLYLATGEVGYMNMIEQTLRNALLGAQSTDGKKWTYFLPLSRYKKWLTGPTNCCFYSGPRGVSRIHEMAYHSDNSNLRVDLFETSNAKVDIKGVTVKLSQQTSYPKKGEVLISIEPKQPVKFILKLRIPEYSSNVHVMLNYKKQPVQIKEGNYIYIERTWNKADRLTLNFDIETVVEKLSNGSGVIKRGSQILSVDRRDNQVDMRYLQIITPVVLEHATPSKDGRTRYRGFFNIEGKHVPVFLTPFSDAGNATVGVKNVHARYYTVFPIAK